MTFTDYLVLGSMLWISLYLLGKARDMPGDVSFKLAGFATVVALVVASFV